MDAGVLSGVRYVHQVTWSACEPLGLWTAARREGLWKSFCRSGLYCGRGGRGF